MLTQIHPARARALSSNIGHPAVLALLLKCGGPTGLAIAGTDASSTPAKPLARRMYTRLVESIQQALTDQTVVVPGTRAAELTPPTLATQLQELLRQRSAVAKQVGEALDAHPLSQFLMAMPGVGIRSRSQTPAYAGLALSQADQAVSAGKHPKRSGNEHL